MSAIQLLTQSAVAIAGASASKSIVEAEVVVAALTIVTTTERREGKRAPQKLKKRTTMTEMNAAVIVETEIAGQRRKTARKTTSATRTTAMTAIMAVKGTGTGTGTEATERRKGRRRGKEIAEAAARSVRTMMTTRGANRTIIATARVETEETRDVGENARKRVRELTKVLTFIDYMNYSSDILYTINVL